MKKLSATLQSIQFLFQPSYWTMNYSYCKTWDAILNDLLDNYDFEVVDQFTAHLGGFEIWTSNFPFAAFTTYNGRYDFVRPSRLTIKRARKKFLKDMSMKHFNA